jgi:hypothetical protein
MGEPTEKNHHHRKIRVSIQFTKTTANIIAKEDIKAKLGEDERERDVK